MWARDAANQITQSRYCASNYEAIGAELRQQDFPAAFALSAGSRTGAETKEILGHMETPETRKTTTNPEIDDENKRLRRLQIMMSMVMQVISEQSDLTLEEASELVASSRRAALNLFPGKELAYDLIYKPRLQRIIRERFRLQ
jgi:hypothetical protein